MPFQFHQTHTEIATHLHIIAALHSLRKGHPLHASMASLVKDSGPNTCQYNHWNHKEYGFQVRGPQPP